MNLRGRKGGVPEIRNAYELCGLAYVEYLVADQPIVELRSEYELRRVLKQHYGLSEGDTRTVMHLVGSIVADRIIEDQID
jgi:hypothetical protein